MIVVLMAALAIAGADGRFIDHPDWVRQPTGSDNPLAYYPAKAQREGVDGRAELDCGIKSEGSLTNCEVLSEEPTQYGFGEAAIKMAHFFRVRSGTPVNARVKLPIRFVSP